LVREAIGLKRDAEKTGKPYNQVWVVFDRDNFPERNFREALRLCNKEKIGFAVSNEAFELWYLLHYDYVIAGLARSQYAEKLSDRMGKTYIKNDAGMYSRLKNRQNKAIERAKKLEKFHFEKLGRHDYYKANPVTTVYQLVETLNEYIH